MNALFVQLVDWKWKSPGRRVVNGNTSSPTYMGGRDPCHICSPLMWHFKRSSNCASCLAHWVTLTYTAAGRMTSTKGSTEKATNRILIVPNDNSLNGLLLVALLKLRMKLSRWRNGFTWNGCPQKVKVIPPPSKGVFPLRFVYLFKSVSEMVGWKSSTPSFLCDLASFCSSSRLNLNYSYDWPILEAPNINHS